MTKEKFLEAQSLFYDAQEYARQVKVEPKEIRQRLSGMFISSEVTDLISEDIDIFCESVKKKIEALIAEKYKKFDEL